MRRILILMMTMGLLLVAAAPAASAKAAHLTPLPDSGQGHWLAGPNANTEVEGSSGKATVNRNGATITVHTNGLTPGDAYTAWVVYFNNGEECEYPFGEPIPSRCGLDPETGPPPLNDIDGVNYLAGKVVGASGKATFSGRLNVGDEPQQGPPPTTAYEPVNPDYHIVIRSHGPKVPSQMPAQIHTFGGGCEGPDVPGIPTEAGQCADVQVFIFETPEDS